MSIDRFKNRDVILASNSSINAQTYDVKDINLLVTETNKLTALPENVFVEMHVYTQDGLYVGGIHDLNRKIAVEGKLNSDLSPSITFDTLNLKFDVYKAISLVDLERGTYKFSITSYIPLVGDTDSRPFYIDIDGISPDRTELKLVLRPDSLKHISSDLARPFPTAVADKASKRATLDNLVINFGNNNVFKVLNLKRVNLSTFGDGYYVKLYEPLPTFIGEKDVAWLATELNDAYLDTVTIIGSPSVSSFNTLKGPNFDFEVTGQQSTETVLQSWNDLLATDTITTQHIIDNIFSGSLTDTTLPIDYSSFDNFIFYSSAAERLSNFKYKLELLEFYDSQINLIQTSLANSSSISVSNIQLNQTRKQNLIGTFDGFERWLFYESTASLFTHDIDSKIGAVSYKLTPYPKFLNSGSVHVHSITSSIAEQWFNGYISTASFYDQQNNNALVNHIPQYLRLDSRNDEFVIFVNMIAQHYDTLWTYIDALTHVRSLDEHPKLGIPKELVHSMAQQYGIQLINGKQTSDLWKYKLGVDASGSYQSTGSLFSKSEEELVTDVWRRIVLNMPYLLKTKGTSRAIKALLNTYGIPQTFISIREYGGPAIDAKEQASVTEERFAYALSFTGASEFIEMPRTYVSNSFEALRPPDTIEFRFRTTNIETMDIVTVMNAVSNNIQWQLYLEPSPNVISGSNAFGRFVLESPAYGILYTSTDYAPIYDGDYWNVRLSTSMPIVKPAGVSSSIDITVQKASDFVKGNITWKVSGSTNFVTTNDIIDNWCNLEDASILYLGGNPTSTSPFVGNIQGYKEYMEVINDTVFNYHTLNPTSYRANNVTGSFYNLVRYYPLGLDSKTYNHATDTIVSSSHPNKEKSDYTFAWGLDYATDATASNFNVGLDGDNYAATIETYYVYGAVAAGLNAKADKIRLEDNRLYRELNTVTQASISTFDDAQLDSNKLNIVVSPQEQLNRDIFDSLGYVNLNNFFATPLADYETEYTDLKRLSREYFKKYSRRTDINKFIRAFSLYDFSVFELIKQFVPMRANLTTGLMIEPHALERSKSSIIKRPIIENPQYEQTIADTLPELDATYTSIETTVTSSIGELQSHVETIEALIDEDIITESASIMLESLATIPGTNLTLNTDDIVGTKDFITEIATLGDVYAPSIYKHENLIISRSQVIIDTPVNVTFRDTIFDLQIDGSDYEIDAGFSLAVRGFKNDLHTILSPFEYANEIIGQNASDIYISMPNTDTLISIDPDLGLDSDRYEIWIQLEDGQYLRKDNQTWSDHTPILVTLTGNTSVSLLNDLLIAGFTLTDPPVDETTITYPVMAGTNVEWITSSISPLEYSPTGSIIDTPRASYYWKKVIYHYSTGSSNLSKRQQRVNLAISASRNDYFSRSLDVAAYRDDESTVLDNLRYEGCKLTAPDINVRTVQTPDSGPVVEVFETNANKIVRQVSSFGTDLIIE